MPPMVTASAPANLTWLRSGSGALAIGCMVQRTRGREPPACSGAGAVVADPRPSRADDGAVLRGDRRHGRLLRSPATVGAAPGLPPRRGPPRRQPRHPVLGALHARARGPRGRLDPLFAGD